MNTGNRHGFTLIELVLTIVIIGILVTVAFRSGTAVYNTAKVEETKQELDALAFATVGNPDLQNNGVRSDFGYVGDVGAMPTNLDALYSNPGSYSTWNGPYIENRFSQTADDYKKDAWGVGYTYSGGVDITSTGSGSNIIRKLANSTGELLLNEVTGVVYDLDGTPPGDTYKDSVSIDLIVPDGVGGMATATTTPDAGGYFSLDSTPIGNHDIEIIYIPDDDTLKRFVTVLPSSSIYGEYYLPSNVWDTSSGGECSGAGSVTLRPMGVGLQTEHSTLGCSANWECVDEVTADEGTTHIQTTGTSWLTDTYTTEDPEASSCTITKVTVYCRAGKPSDLASASAKPVIRTYGTVYEGSSSSLTTSWVTINHEWTTNPNTSVAWTWSEIEALECGVSMVSSSSTWKGQCTQVYVEVDYEP